jgi:hypothetical protein
MRPLNFTVRGRRLRYLFMALVALSMEGSASAATLATPEEAVRAMEAAYASGDADAAVATRDFAEEARRIYLQANPAFLAEGDILKETARVLELGYRKDLREKVFPLFKHVTCVITQVTYLEADLANVSEDCTISGKAISKEHLHVFKSALGWRVVHLPDDP